MLITIDQARDAAGFFTIRPHDGTDHGDTADGPVATVYGAEQAARIVACWNACEGLDLPEGLPPGTIRKLVRAAADELDRRGENDAGYRLPLGPMVAALDKTCEEATPEE